MYLSVNLFKKAAYLSLIMIIVVSAYYSPFMHRMGAGIALLAGMLMSTLVANPDEQLSKKLASLLLTWSVVGLGFGMNLLTVLKAGAEGIGFTLFTILICTFLGLTLGKLLQNKTNISLLITFGSSICGGSAIAAIAPVIKAQQHEITVALAVVFFLNAISLFIFPAIAHYFQLSEAQFGLWSALAIHDTSSVVGATMQYGPEALNVGTTVKLARALWIVPLTIALSVFYSSRFFSKSPQEQKLKSKRPWFILGFVLASALTTWLPIMKTPAIYLHHLAEFGLIIALFCIGASLSIQTLKAVGIRPLIQGALIWCFMAIITFYIISVGAF